MQTSKINQISSTKKYTGCPVRIAIQTHTEFIYGMFYNACQTLNPLSLANNHTPDVYLNIEFVGYTEEHDGEVKIANFKTLDGKEISFDMDFVNTGNAHDNSMVITHRLKL